MVKPFEEVAGTLLVEPGNKQVFGHSFVLVAAHVVISIGNQKTS